MCDITYFIITAPIPGCTSAVIAQHFMQDVLMKFGLYYLVVIDDGMPFKNVFTTMCDCLQIKFELDILVETFHRFLNKVVTIALNDMDNISIFVYAGITTTYAWNSALIDGTDIMRSIPTIGWELWFLLDGHLTPLPIFLEIKQI